MMYPSLLTMTPEPMPSCCHDLPPREGGGGGGGGEAEEEAEGVVVGAAAAADGLFDACFDGDDAGLDLFEHVGVAFEDGSAALHGGFVDAEGVAEDAWALVWGGFGGSVLGFSARGEGDGEGGAEVEGAQEGRERGFHGRSEERDRKEYGSMWYRGGDPRAEKRGMGRELLNGCAESLSGLG